MKIINTIVIALTFLQLSGAIAQAAKCADYSTCRQAVKNWCAGNHNRADGDGDGIPCENVCGSREQVKQIMSEIGCNK